MKKLIDWFSGTTFGKYFLIVVKTIGKFLKDIYASEIIIGAFGLYKAIFQRHPLFGLLIVLVAVLLAINTYKQKPSTPVA